MVLGAVGIEYEILNEHRKGLPESFSRSTIEQILESLGLPIEALSITIHPSSIEVKLLVKQNGKLLAVKDDLLVDTVLIPIENDVNG